MIKWILMSPPPRSRNRTSPAPKKAVPFYIYPSSSLLEITNCYPGLYGNHCLSFIVLLSIYAFVNSTLFFACFWMESYCTYFLFCFFGVFLCIVCYFVQYIECKDYFIIVGHLGCLDYYEQKCCSKYSYTFLMVQYPHFRLYTKEHSCWATGYIYFNFNAMLFSKMVYQFPFPLIMG